MESIQSSVTSGNTTEVVSVDTQKKMLTGNEEYFMDCVSSFDEPEKFNVYSDSDSSSSHFEEGVSLEIDLATWH